MSTKSKSDSSGAPPADFDERSARLRAIIKPLRAASHQDEFQWTSIEKMFKGWSEDYGPIDLTPDFQRGHVWTSEQRHHYLENALRGVVPSSGFVVQLNCPNWNSAKSEGDLPKGFQCIDGLQRLTTVRACVHEWGNRPVRLNTEGS